MTLYSLNGDTPAPIPFRIVLPGGRTRTDPTSFEPEEIAAAGYTVAPNPPAYDPATQRPPKWTGSSWTVAAIPLAELRLAKREALAAHRFTVETGGLSVSGATIKTDRESQALITGAVTYLTMQPDVPSINWKADAGQWVTVTREMVFAMGAAVGAHVQACFDRECALDGLIGAASSAIALAAIDITTGWPKAADETPDAFAFTDVSDADLSTAYESNEITVSGLGTGVSVAVSVLGGQYSKNGGAYTSSAGTASNGDTFKLKVTSSASNETAVAATLTISSVSDTWTVTTEAAASGGTSATRYSVMGTGMRWPTGSQSNATNTYFATEFYVGTPDYETADPRVFCASFWSPQSGGETYIAAGTVITIMGWSIETAPGVWTTCDGADESGVATVTNASAGAWLPRIAATLAANTMYRARLVYQVSGTGLAVPSTSIAGVGAPAGQERTQGGTTSLWSRLTDNTALNNSGGISYKPAMLIGKGGDGRPAVLVLGDSIGYSEAHRSSPRSWTARNEHGYIAIGLDSNDGCQRLGYHISCIQGQAPLGTYGWYDPVNWPGKIAALQAVKDMQDDWPFDLILNEHIRNSIPYNISGGATIRAAMAGYFDTLATLFAKPITQLESLSSTSSSDGYATVANQTPVNGFAYGSTNAGHAWPFNEDVGGPDGLGDPDAYFRANGYIEDSIAPWRYIAADLEDDRDVYPVMPYASTVASAYAGGNSLIVAAAPQIGSAIVLQQDGGAYGSTRNVTNVTGDGPYTLTTDGPAGTGAAVGNVVREVWGDGVHPSGTNHRDVLAQALVDWKIARGWVE